MCVELRYVSSLHNDAKDKSAEEANFVTCVRDCAKTAKMADTQSAVWGAGAP